jgi:DNA-directed RNA polymerase subunit RPC12/RpoP
LARYFFFSDMETVKKNLNSIREINRTMLNNLGNEPNNFECIICQNDEKVIPVKYVPCGHFFCYACSADLIEKTSLSSGLSCPLCRSKIEDYYIEEKYRIKKSEIEKVGTKNSKKMIYLLCTSSIVVFIVLIWKRYYFLDFVSGFFKNFVH